MHTLQIPAATSGTTITLNGHAVLTCTPVGTPTEPPVGSDEFGQHYLVTPLVGPDAGSQVRIPPSAIRLRDAG